MFLLVPAVPDKSHETIVVVVVIMRSLMHHMSVTNQNTNYRQFFPRWSCLWTGYMN